MTAPPASLRLGCFPCAALAALLACGEFALAQEGGEPAGAPTSATKSAEADVTIESVAAAFTAGRYAAALEDARRLAARKPRPGKWDRLRLSLIEAESCLHLERHEEALSAADRCLGLVNLEGKNWEPWFKRASNARAWALFACGRAAEAAATLDELCRRLPAEESFPGVLRLRGLLKAGTGIVVDPDYRGKWREDPRIAAGLARMRSGVGLAADRFRERLGDPVFVLPPVVLQVEDRAGKDPDWWMAARTYPRGNASVGVIKVYSDCLMSDGEGEVAALTHELCHILRHQGRGKPRVPQWVEEGLAGWFEASGEQDLWSHLVGRVAMSGGVRTLLQYPKSFDPVEPWEGRSEDRQRLFGKVLFHYLERTKGRASVQEYARALMETTQAPDSAFHAAFGGTPAALQKELSERFAEWARRSIEGVDEAVALEAVYAGRDLEAGRAAYEGFLARHAHGPLRALVRMRFLLVLLRHGRYDSAAEHLEEVRRDEQVPRDLRHLGDIVGLQVALGRGDSKEAARIATEILFNNPRLEAEVRDGLQRILDAIEESRRRRSKPPVKEGGG